MQIKEQIQTLVSKYDCGQCGEKAVLDVAKYPDSPPAIGIVYCATCSGGVCGTHGFVAIEAT